jgi:hypothetical protein
MQLLSLIPKETMVKKVITFEEVISEQERKEQSLKNMFEMATSVSDGPLKQDLMEGVAEDEW